VELVQLRVNEQGKEASGGNSLFRAESTREGEKKKALLHCKWPYRYCKAKHRKEGDGVFWDRRVGGLHSYLI